MAFVQWSLNLSVGIDFMDADHRKLMELLTELHDLVGTGQGQAAMVEKLDELIDFTEQHFRLEERLMEENAYDEFEQHRQLHELLLQEVAELRQHLTVGEKNAGHEVMDFLKDWLMRHILESDKDLGGFLQRKLGRGEESKSANLDILGTSKRDNTVG
jgi:hemerythrin